MTLEKQIELLKEWHGRAEMYLPIMSSEDIERFLRWLEDYKQLKDDYADLDNRLRTANTENDRLQSVSSWVPCSERMPNKDGEYLCVSNSEFKILPYRNGEFYCTCFDGVLRCCNSSVTHWMPLPNPPVPADKPCGGDINA